MAPVLLALTTLSALLALTACDLPVARHHENHALPLPAARVQQLNDGDAVVSYLRQRDADPSVCNPTASGPHVVFTDPRHFEDLVDGIGRGARPDKWADCMHEMLGKVQAPDAAVLLGRLLEQYVLRIAYANLEDDPAVMEQLEVIRRVYSERQPGRDATPARRRATLTALRELDEEALSPFRRKVRDAALLVLYLEEGMLPDGRRVNIESLDELVAVGAEDELLIYSRRIPDEALRTEAARRLVRLRIARSPFARVQSDPRAIETRVMALGRNPVALAANWPTRVDFDAARMPVRGISILQDVRSQRARLASWRGQRQNVSVVPALDLRPVLTFTVPGYSAVLRLCAAAEELRVEPCVDARELSIGLPFAHLEDDGHFRIAEEIEFAHVLSLARAGPGFRIPILLSGAPLVDAIWEVDYETTGPAVFAPGYGEAGPPISVVVDSSDPRFHLYAINAYGRDLQVVIEPDEMRQFAVVAAGGNGRPGDRGQDGNDGSNGTNGTNASCPNTQGTSGGSGSNGGPGGAGGPGGNGGPGGSIAAKLICGPSRCPELMAELRSTLHAPGGSRGPGGAGGSGGRGGSGGSGGSSTTCTDADGQSHSVSGGSAGSDGSDGPRGAHGPDGLPGPNGRVILEVQPPENT
ncbi:MAG: hypothetical protein DRJ42_31450 [Deltaproteobacteria bacterium]|nr:MAG: hypothetical protein DRJ42_31450 [Deltaproteobacteria bacterium]